ncbi:MAG: hypothetical protein PVS2B2_16110 [Candidatus Acidiferrum sp.]
MEMRNSIKKSGWGGTLFLAAALMSTFLFLSAPIVRANEACQRRLVRADHRLHDAARRHGWESRQAEHARHELHEAREYCWAHSHRWWDEDGRRWHTDHDWDDHDHDRR